MDSNYVEVVLGYALIAIEVLDYEEKEKINLIGNLEVAAQLFSDRDAMAYFNDYRECYYDNLIVVIDGTVIPNEYNKVRLEDMAFETPRMKSKVCNTLGRYGLKYIRDLHHITKEDFLSMNSFGKKSYYELTAAVRKMIGKT